MQKSSTVHEKSNKISICCPKCITQILKAWAPYLMLVELSRFYLIQVLIGSIQLLNRMQVGLVWLLNLIYLIFFFGTIFKKKAVIINGREQEIKLIPSTFYKLKLICQEICILLILSTILLFSLTTENSKFRNSSIYQFLEYVIIVSIVIASAAEFLWDLVCLIIQITQYLKRKKNERLRKRRKKRMASV